MSDAIGPRAGSGRPSRQQEPLPVGKRLTAWVVWWTLLMAFWVWADDSLMLAELLAGAGAAAIGASVAELVQHQSATHFRPRAEWVTPVFRLPAKMMKDLAVVCKALWDRVVHRQAPPSAFRAIPVRAGGRSPEDVTRRALLIAGMSFTPNTFALGIDQDKDLMVVHQLVSRPEVPGR